MGPTSILYTGATIGTYFAAATDFQYTAPFVMDGSTSVLVCTVPGTAMQHYYRSSAEAYPVIRLDLQAGGVTVATREVRLTTVIQDGPMQHGPNNWSGTAAYDESRVIDTVWLPFGSSAHSMASSFALDPESSLAAASLRGRTVQYPDSWGIATETALEALWAASTLFRATYGRGLYLGSSTHRYNAPMFVPGSGTPLFSVLVAEYVQVEQTAQPPDQYPTASSVSPFASSVRANATYDHGGPVGYSFYGVIINPVADDYKGQAIMQIAGGPTGPRAFAFTTTKPMLNSEELDGTAIDAFFPTHRPILRKK
jgi:hypothetical protein